MFIFETEIVTSLQGQYVFVYLAIVEAYMAGETASSCSEFTRKFASKKNLKATIEKEYQVNKRIFKYLVVLVCDF